jgi:hypothetical protein
VRLKRKDPGNKNNEVFKTGESIFYNIFEYQ